MQKMLTFKEKKLVKNLMQESGDLRLEGWNELGAFCSIGLGGFFMIFVSLTTLTNLSDVSIKYVLLPGIGIGMMLLLVGSFGLHVSKKAEEKKILAGLIRKLMD